MPVSKLVVKNLHKSFFQGGKTLEVLRGINIEFNKGVSFAITGVSGSGKSTLMHILGGLDEPSGGSVFYDDHNFFKLRQKKKDEFLNKELGFVFQFHYLIKELNVYENIILPGLIKGESFISCKKRAENLLEYVGLIDKIYSYPTQLSGGELQRVAILRAIFNKPSFLFADEPTGNLDAANASTIVDLLEQCRKEWGMALILSSHDRAVYGRMENIFRLQDGILQAEK